jgi:hypothetical protein
MPRGGAQPGERRGGRKKGTPNRRTVEARLLAGRLETSPLGVPEGATAMLGKEVLAKYMIVFDQLAAKHADEPVLFQRYASAAVECAKLLAPYQSPTYRCIALPPPPPQQGPQRFTLKIFDRHNGADELAGVHEGAGGKTEEP